jgi:hypothetical protein
MVREKYWSLQKILNPLSTQDIKVKLLLQSFAERCKAEKLFYLQISPRNFVKRNLKKFKNTALSTLHYLCRWLYSVLTFIETLFNSF